jgi:4-carboxymuconolactone decarboxylase
MTPGRLRFNREAQIGQMAGSEADFPICASSAYYCERELFLTGEQSTMNKELFDKGMKVRREVLGAEYVDAAIANADDFSRPLQELVTEFCWGEVWNRPGLDRKTRSIINLAMLTALNRPHEIKLHLRGAINNGLSKSEIGEIFLQTAVYCGVPAAIDSFRVAREFFKEMDGGE